MRFSVLRIKDISQREEVIVATSCGTAKCELDYERMQKQLTFEPEEMQKDLELDIYLDDEIEFTEGFHIQLLQCTSAYAGELGQPNIALVEIFDRNTLSRKV